MTGSGAEADAIDTSPAGALSIVVPAFNERRRLPETLSRLRDFARHSAWGVQCVIVDDGSTDGTQDVIHADARSAADDAPRTERFSVRLLRHDRRRGKGAALRAGMLAAEGDCLLACDADLSTPIGELARLSPWLERGYDVAIGSRDLPDSRLDPPQPRARRLAAWTFRALRRRLLLPEIRDTQCGFKLFRRAAAQEIFRRTREDGWLIDVEALALAENLGYRVREVGVTWRDDPDSRVRVWRDAGPALAALLRIRRRLRNLGQGARPDGPERP